MTSNDSTINVQSLFRSFKFGKNVVRNRLVMAPMTRGFSPGGIPTAGQAAYYRKRALGGIGLIITEGTYFPHKSVEGYPDVPFLRDGAAKVGWKKVVDSVHSAGALIFSQLWHVGIYCRPGFDRGHRIQRLGPSRIAHPGLYGQSSSVVPERMTERDIEEGIAAYVDAAKTAKETGFDGIEIHGAHGYWIDQFLWEMTNRRTDKYGGTLRERSRFACEIVKAVRAEVGSAYPIIFRFSNWKLNVYDERGRIFQQPKDMEQLLTPLIESGVDVFHASTRHFDVPEFAGSPLNLAGWTKKISGKPTITVGSIGLSADFISERQGVTVTSSTLDRLLERLHNDEFDLVAIGRALLSDPFWAQKIRNGQLDSIINYDKSSLERLV